MRLYVSPYQHVIVRRPTVFTGLLKPALLCVSADLIYEDVQKEEGLQGPKNGWSSSEFESYDEQSDSERAPTRSKVRVC